MKDRQQTILNAIIKDYVKKAQPVSSGFLFKKYKFNLSPATIRSEMKNLEDQGYLFQPHTSAGRIPTEKAYKFFIKSLEQQKHKTPTPRKNNDFVKEIQEQESLSETFKQLTKSLAELSGDLAFGGVKELDYFYQAGLSNLLKEPEFQDLDYFSKTVKALENFDERIEKLFEEMPKCQTKVFIGKENPINKNGNFTLIVSSCGPIRKKHGVFGILGPIRMRYDYNISLIDRLRDYLESFYEQ